MPFYLKKKQKLKDLKIDDSELIQKPEEMELFIEVKRNELPSRFVYDYLGVLYSLNWGLAILTFIIAEFLAFGVKDVKTVMDFIAWSGVAFILSLIFAFFGDFFITSQRVPFRTQKWDWNFDFGEVTVHKYNQKDKYHLDDIEEFIIKFSSDTANRAEGGGYYYFAELFFKTKENQRVRFAYTSHEANDLALIYRRAMSFAKLFAEKLNKPITIEDNI